MSEDDARAAAVMRIAARRSWSVEALAVNRDLDWSTVFAEQRRGLLHLHRSDRRDEDRMERRALIAPLVQRHPHVSAQSLAAFIKRTSKNTALLDVALRTLRADIGAMRKLAKPLRR